MKIQRLKIQNFKSFRGVTLYFNEDLNILTGVNNSGKTTVLEALALWNECFEKLISQAQRAVKGKFSAGQYVFGPSQNRYFEFDEINSVRSPYFEDLFRDRNRKLKIRLSAKLKSSFEEVIEITFVISDSVGRYIIELADPIDYDLFNRMFKNLPESIDTYYTSPVAAIELNEKFDTDPNIKAIIKERNSSKVIRNRIYRLYLSPRFQQFQSDLSYILFNNTFATISLFNHSDIQRDQRVVINYKIGADDVEKDIALLGSGTLQAIEILLNLYRQSEIRKDLNVILLDEPDSHIHRNIQQRLIEVLTRFSNDNQLFLTTHNESLIRSSPLSALFHLDGTTDGEVHNMYRQDLAKLQTPHFKGFYPAALNPLIKSLGNDTGLDFINAIEADRIVFVEGDDDARVIHRLLQEYPQNHNRKIMYWVLGGVSKVFDKINSYKVFFSDIKNSQTLWDKSYLIIDKDRMTDGDIQTICNEIGSRLNLKNHYWSAYTMESILFSNLPTLTTLLSKYLVREKAIESNSLNGLLAKLEQSYNNMKSVLEERYSKENIGDVFVKQYKGEYVEKTKQMFSLKQPIIENDDIKLLRFLEKYYNETLQQEHFYKLMNKTDVEMTINSAIADWGVSIDIENDYYEIIKQVDKASWFPEWDKLRNI